MAKLWTRNDLSQHLEHLGVSRGDVVMVHADLRAIGPMLNGPVTLVQALQDAVGQSGTIIAYTDWNAGCEAVIDAEGRVPAHLKREIEPFDPAHSRARRTYGTFPEFIRTTSGALRSANPGASFAAVGARAQWITSDHALQYGYGEQSPFARACAPQMAKC